MARNGRKGFKSDYGLVALWRQGEALPQLSRWGVIFQLYVQAWRSLIKTPLNSVLTIATIAVSLVLFGGFVLLLENASALLVSSRDTFRMNVYLHDEVNEGERIALQRIMEKEPAVESIRFKSKEEAIAEFRKTLGEYASLVEGLDSQNPLPASFDVKFTSDDETARQMAAFKTAFGSRKEIEKIQYREGTLAQLVSLVRLVRTAGVLAVLFMFMMTGFIIATTIKLALYSYRDEIQIMRLVGATESYVKIPFIIEGCLQGVLGGIASVVMVFGLYRALRSLVSQSSLLSYLIPHFHFLSVSAIVLVVFTGVAVGVAGSLFAVRRAMPGIE